MKNDAAKHFNTIIKVTYRTTTEAAIISVCERAFRIEMVLVRQDTFSSVRTHSCLLERPRVTENRVIIILIIIIVGPFGEEVINDNGDKLIDMCEQNSLQSLNGYFQHKRIH